MCGSNVAYDLYLILSQILTILNIFAKDENQSEIHNQTYKFTALSVKNYIFLAIQKISKMVKVKVQK